MDDDDREAQARDEALQRAEDALALAVHTFVDAWLASRGETAEELALAKRYASELFLPYEDRLHQWPWGRPPGGEDDGEPKEIVGQ